MTRPLASIPQRLLARLVDGLITGLVAYLLLYLLGWVGYLLAVAGYVGYEVWFVSTSGQTPGKRLLGIAVSNAGSDERPSTAQAARRTLPIVLGAVPVTIVALLGPLLFVRAVWDSRRQGFHDLFADTIVVRAGRVAGTEDGAPHDERYPGRPSPG